MVLLLLLLLSKAHHVSGGHSSSCGPRAPCPDQTGLWQPLISGSSRDSGFKHSNIM